VAESPEEAIVLADAYASVTETPQSGELERLKAHVTHVTNLAYVDHDTTYGHELDENGAYREA